MSWGHIEAGRLRENCFVNRLIESRVASERELIIDVLDRLWVF